MALGGKRLGAGRKKGVPNKRTQAVQEAVQASGATPLDIMLGAARAAWAEATKGDRIDLDKAATAAAIAKDAAPYVHPKLASIEHTGPDGGPIQTEDVTPLERARLIAFALEKGARAAAPSKTED